MLPRLQVWHFYTLEILTVGYSLDSKSLHLFLKHESSFKSKERENNLKSRVLIQEM